MMNNLSGVTSVGLIATLFSPELGHSLWRNLHISRCILLGTHYDTLKVRRDCSRKEIREAFIKLSKQSHPDKNHNNPEFHSQFVKLNEAYSILSKPEARANYDLSLSPSAHRFNVENNSGTDPKEKWPFRDDTFWEQRDKSQDKFYNRRSYYGISGLKRLPNFWIVVFCIFFTFTGVGLQFLAIRRSMTFQRERLDEVSIHNSLLHSYARQQAVHNGNEVQLELLRKRLLDSSEDLNDINSQKKDV